MMVAASNNYWETWEKLYNLCIETKCSIRLWSAFTHMIIKSPEWNLKFVSIIEDSFVKACEHKSNIDSSLRVIKNCCTVALLKSSTLEDPISFAKNVANLYKKFKVHIPVSLFYFLIGSVCNDAPNVQETSAKVINGRSNYRGRGKRAYEFFESMRNFGFEPKYYHFEKLIDYLTRRRNRDDLVIVSDIFFKLSSDRSYDLLSEKSILMCLSYFLIFRQEKLIKKSIKLYFESITRTNDKSVYENPQIIASYNRLINSILISLSQVNPHIAITENHSDENIMTDDYLPSLIMNLVFCTYENFKSQMHYSEYNISVLLSGISKILSHLKVSDSLHENKPDPSINLVNYQHRLVEFAMILLDDLSKHDSEINVVTVTSLIRICEKLGDPNLSIYFFYSMDLDQNELAHEPGFFEFLNLSHITKTPDPEIALDSLYIEPRIIDSISEKLASVHPNLYTFNVIIQLYLSRDMPVKASSYLHSAVNDHNLIPNIKTFAPFANYFDRIYPSDPETSIMGMRWVFDCMKFFDVPFDSQISKHIKKRIPQSLI
ncbi:hypothetical protein AYI68_g5463 [Smittium mucronatum]|uniref:Uncharacterized protein n=1 Tax=Smittium mucronatum TaxID=133383 RepID=A0A1R0GU88_9FUNG|nr:hypothetical protein AYI68_g5463 [Smittium mucronatum]